MKNNTFRKITKLFNYHADKHYADQLISNFVTITRKSKFDYK